MKQIYANNFTTLEIGRKGENLAKQVVFDIRDLESLYGSGTVEVIYQRPGDAQPYPLAVQRDGTLVTWDVTATDTEMSNAYGKCELRYYVGETLAKSKIWRTWVEPAMDTPSETAPPEPEQGWVDQIISVGAAAKASADAAKADADRATALAAEVSKKAAQTAQDASDAAKAMEAAQTAQRLAKEAQGAAEAARTAAAAAQSAAEKAATDAAAAKQGAETAMQAAQEAAAAAANALEAIQTLYQEMQTWAQGVIQDVNAAGSAAVQSVQSAGDAQVQRVTDEGTTQTANAKAQANAAAQSAAGAAQSAQEAAESAAVYDDVVADVNQLKQDIAAITPDDTTVDGKPWTSKKIVDTICQPFEESGNHVQVYPVENYPLGVKVSWEPTQEGSGDPSPDNIRPITGRNSVMVERCGENLVKFPYRITAASRNGLVITSQQDGGMIVNGTATADTWFLIEGDIQNRLPVNTPMTLSGCPAGGSIKSYYIGLYLGGKWYSDTGNGNTDIKFTTREIQSRVEVSIVKGTVCNNITFYPKIEVGTTITPYSKYQGNDYNIALPETVYGGTLDVETGVVRVDTDVKQFDGTENWRYSSANNVFYVTTDVAYKLDSFMCSHYKAKVGMSNIEDKMAAISAGAKDWHVIIRDDEFAGDVTLFKTRLSEMKSAGKPLQVSRVREDPYTIQLTPQQIAALSGVNTIYTDADGVIVTGAEDPKHTITELKNAIISLGGNV